MTAQMYVNPNFNPELSIVKLTLPTWEPMSDKSPPLLPVPGCLSGPNDRLCESCAELNLTPGDFVVTRYPGKADPTERKIRFGTFGLVRDVRAKSTFCPLCRLFFQSLGPKTIPDEEDGVPTTVTYFWDEEAQVPDSEDSENVQNGVRYVRWLTSSIELQGGGYCITFTPPWAPTRMGVLANDAPTTHKSLLPRIIGDQIHFAMVRRWIDTCRSLHRDQCWGPHPDLEHHGADILDELPSFQVIDVIDKCLTSPPPNCNYVALSYVWGPIDPLSILRTLKSNVLALRRPGSLDEPDISHRVPRTIRDAMHVVEQLHMRYIWIDSLCIIQDDDGEGGTKKQSLAKMAHIYGAATFVMIAACGVDAHSELPGLYTGTKRNQSSLQEISPGFRLAFKQLYQNSLEDTVYISRAWTFQEFFLARKKLLFVDGQVIYACKVIEQFREDEVCEGQYSQPDIDELSDDDVESNIESVEEIISEYSSRSITYDTDVYHALSAMNHIIKRSLGSDLCHGIPDTLFDWFLLWDQKERQTRRKITPSWSWSGWLGRSGTEIWRVYTRSIVRVRDAQPKRTWIIWYQRKAHDSHDCIRVDKSRTEEQDAASTQRMQKRLAIDCTRTEPTPRKLIGAPIYIEDSYYPHPGSGFLQFWTISAQFNLGDLTSDVSQTDRARMLNNGYKIAGIFGISGHELGEVMLDADWFKDNVPGRHEFIILCEGRTQRAENKNDFDRKAGWKYSLMLIEWKGDGQWAERVAVGAIEIKGLNEALDGAVWKEIVLG